MNLFNSKTLSHNIDASSPIPEEHQTILQQWSELILSDRIYDHKEVSLHSEFKSLIVEKVLGYEGPVGEETYTVSSEQSILSGAVDLALGHFQKDSHQIIAPFELKGAKTRDLDAIMPGRAKSPFNKPGNMQPMRQGLSGYWFLIMLKSVFTVLVKAHNFMKSLTSPSSQSLKNMPASSCS